MSLNGGAQLSSANSDQRVIDEVRRYYGETQSPYYLAVLGEFLRSHQIDIPTGMRLKDYLKGSFQGQLSIVQDAEVPAKIAVALPDNQDSIRQQLADRFAAATNGPSLDYDRLPFSLKVAFCVMPPSGTGVYFRTIRPFRYVFGLTALDETFVEIGEEFRPPRLLGSSVPNLSTEDKKEVYQHIEMWANANDIDLGNIRYGRGPTSFRSADKTNPLAINALHRLVQAQEADFRGRILIPGDIAITLMSMP